MTEEQDSLHQSVGLMQGRVESLTKSVERLQHDQSDQNQKLDKILETVSVAKGGLRMLVIVGSVGTSVAAFVHWLWSTFHFGGIGK